MKDNDWQATWIKVLAVMTAAPRWVGALLAAEGLIIPTDWAWWVIVSAIASAAMAAVEGWAFSYVFEAWRNQEDSKSNRLGWLIALSAVLFVIVLAPYIATSVNHKPLSETLSNMVALYVWSIAVGGSTIAIVASVGYAQKHKTVKQPKVVDTKPATKAQPTQAEGKQTETIPQAVDAGSSTELQKSPRERILDLHYEHPGMKVTDIAKQVDVTRQYASAVIAKNGRASQP